MLGLCAEKANPEKFGFDFERELFSKKIKQLQYHKIELAYYYGIQKSLRQNYKLKDVEKSIRWFYKLDLNKAEGHYLHRKPPNYEFKEKIFQALPPLLKQLYNKIKN